MNDARLKVLLIEDCPAEASRLTGVLAASHPGAFDVDRAVDAADGLRRLVAAVAEEREAASGVAGGPDAVLLDVSRLEGAADILARIHTAAGQAPVVVLGPDAEAAAQQALWAGAQDYLPVKDVDGPALARSIRHAIARRRAEGAMEFERDLLHTLLDYLPDQVYFKDDRSRFVRVSRSQARHLGADDPAAVLGKTDSDFFAPEHARPAFEDERQIMRTGQPLVGKVEEEVFPDGRIRWALTSKAPLRDGRGRVVGTFGVTHDITDLKKMEDALAEERNLLRSLIDSLPHQIYIKDRDSRFVLGNLAVRQFFGLKAGEEIAGKSDFDFFPPHAAEGFRAEEVEILQGRLAGVNREGVVARADGREAWVFTTKVPLRNSRGRIVGLVGANRDITERKRAEAQLKRSNADLAAREQELLAALAELNRSHEALAATQLQLAQVEKMESIGRLAAGIAHEVKNPLAVVALGLDYLSHGVAHAANGEAAAGPLEADENVPVVLRSMQDAVRRADAVVKGLLNFSAPKALEPADMDLNAAIEQSLLFVKHELIRQKLVLHKVLPAGLPQVRLDANKIKQVFVNLLTNAVHATPEGGVLTVRTFARRLSAGDPYVGDRAADRFRPGDLVVVAEVDDTGQGIPEEKLPKVFDPFFTTKPAGKGTGLGLTVTKTIVDLHAGVIHLRNRPEGGVRATLLFKAVAE